MQLLRDRGFARTEEELESFAFMHSKGYIELAGIEEGAPLTAPSLGIDSDHGQARKGERRE
jgi:hypothetical protein